MSGLSRWPCYHRSGLFFGIVDRITEIVKGEFNGRGRGLMGRDHVEPGYSMGRLGWEVGMYFE